VWVAVRADSPPPTAQHRHASGGTAPAKGASPMSSASSSSRPRPVSANELSELVTRDRLIIALTDEAWWDYAERAFVIENVRCMQDILTWKQLYDSKSDAWSVFKLAGGRSARARLTPHARCALKARTIVNLYLAPGAPLLLNVSDQLRSRVLADVSKCADGASRNKVPFRVFDAVFNEAAGMLVDGAYRDFVLHRLRAERGAAHAPAPAPASTRWCSCGSCGPSRSSEGARSAHASSTASTRPSPTHAHAAPGRPKSSAASVSARALP